MSAELQQLLAERDAEIETLKAALSELRAKSAADAVWLTRLREQLEAAQKDTARLDWMHSMRDERVWFLAAPGTHAGQTIREAIDAAMIAQPDSEL